MSEFKKLQELLEENGIQYTPQNREANVIIIDYYTDPHPVCVLWDGTLQVGGLTAEQVIKAVKP